ncbi:MAG: hypothetical protein Q9O24_10725 [Gammaproteobacteria bacterium]|nr:hypothetical protein [Gammaproteobacteria bacterium]MDQ7075600.1 hypothetical protein [Gammaproteobacteria bacterium]
MNKYLIGRSMQIFFLLMSVIIWLGIWLTGFDVVHWVLYLPAVFFVFAGVTRICPGMIILNKLTGNN